MSSVAAPEAKAVLPLAVSMGDPAGIGLDITLAAWAERERTELPDFLLYADPAIVRERARLLGIDVSLVEVDPAEADRTHTGLLKVRPIRVERPVVCGTPDPRNAAAVISAIADGVADIKAGTVAGLMTNPIAKKPLADAGFIHPGHTEFLGELAERHWGQQVSPVMMLACDDLRVVPVTVHVALRQVPLRLTQDLIIDTARTTHSALHSDFGIARPRIAVCGLNPHAGEGGLMGTEEIDVIEPAVARLRAMGWSVTGPHSADTLFHQAARASYDAVLCMYHDQALIPLKTLAFDRGVNVTLGLPFVRTSPDHGTAFALAGTGKASPRSFVEAMRLAGRLAAKGASRTASTDER